MERPSAGWLRRLSYRPPPLSKKTHDCTCGCGFLSPSLLALGTDEAQGSIESIGGDPFMAVSTQPVGAQSVSKQSVTAPAAPPSPKRQTAGTPTVDTRKVAGRRVLSFRGLDEVLTDASALVASPHTKTLGNWPLPQLLTHLASTINNSIDGFSSKAPLFVRLIGPFLKSGMIKNKMRPGIKLPPEAEKLAFPAAESAEEALRQLRHALSRCKCERMTAAHPAFGKMTHEQWLQLHLRHSELHLSYAVPE